MACASASDECPTTVKSSTREHVCAICLEQYRKPRGLSCLHTFCEGCIQSCILKELEKGVQLSAIKCPVCQEDTDPVDATKSPVEWVKDLKPVTGLARMMRTFDESEATVVLCDNCSGENQPTAVAVKYCRDCKQYVCKDCTSSHKRLKVLAGHKLVPVEEASSEHPVDLGAIEICLCHTGERVKFYCEDHNRFCCSTCAFVNHRQCDDVSKLMELGQQLKSGDGTENLQSKMTALQGKVKETKSSIISNRKDIDTQADAMVEKAVDLRDQLVTAMDRLVVMVTEECRQVKKEHGIEGDDDISSLERLSAVILSSCSLLESVMNHGTETQIFIAFHKVDEQVKSYEELVNKGLESRDLHLDLFHQVGDFVSFLNSFSDVDVKKVSKKSGSVDITKCSVKPHPVINITGNPHMVYAPRYSGIVHLPDGRLVATDQIHHLCCLLNEKCTATAYITLPGEPTNLAVIDPSEVVIPLYNTQQLQRVTVGSRSLTLNGTIPCQGREPRCVSRVSDTEVAVGWKEGLSIITLDGTEQMYLGKDSSDRTIQHTSESRIVVERKTSSIIQCCTNTNKVYCFNFTGKVKFQYKGKLTKPRGPSLDRDGNVYICDWTFSNPNVHQLSPTGELLSVISTIREPYTTCFNPKGDELLVMNSDTMSSNATTSEQKFRFVPENK